jgi:small-conductance mechanosensitive channel
LWLLVPLALLAGASVLELAPRLEGLVTLAAIAGLAFQAALWTTRMVRDWVARRGAARGDGESLMALALIGFAARVAIWTVVALFVLDQLGLDITALVAGLGIGGVAIALAVQNILGDVFASLSIVLDKPFVVGDFIAVDGLSGTIERVGIKTTRVRSLGGELLVFSNSDLLKSRIRNFQQLRERRIAFSVGVTYETPPPTVRAIPALLRAAVEAQDRTRFDRAHFKAYGDSALVFEVVYYVLVADFNVYMDVQQRINLAILERFAADGIDFAYPTRTVHVVQRDTCARAPRGARAQA